MNKLNNIENSGNVNHNSQSKRETVTKRARKYVMSVAFAAAILTVLFTSASTAQAQNGKCFYNSNAAATATSATCPINNDSGYYYQKTNRGWQPVSYYKGASTNILYVYAYALRRWGAIAMPKGVVYIQTTSGWTPARGSNPNPLLDSDPLVRIVLITQNRPSSNINLLRDKENPYPASSEAKQMRQRGCKRQ